MSRPNDLAAALIAARQSGERIATFDADLLPLTLADAYAVQDRVVDRLGARVAGWKVGASAADAEPNCAPLFADIVRPAPARFGVTPESLCAVEAELAVMIGRDLPARAGARYTEAEVWASLASLHVAIELLDSRYADRAAAGTLAQLADNLTNGGFCFGPAMAGGLAIDFLHQPSRLLVDGGVKAEAVGGNAAGHPGRLLAWLANHAAARGRPLEAGMIVTTGSHTHPVTAAPGAAVTAEFPGIGRASLQL